MSQEIQTHIITHALHTHLKYRKVQARRAKNVPQISNATQCLESTNTLKASCEMGEPQALCPFVNKWQPQSMFTRIVQHTEIKCFPGSISIWRFGAFFNRTWYGLRIIAKRMINDCFAEISFIPLLYRWGPLHNCALIYKMKWLPPIQYTNTNFASLQITNREIVGNLHSNCK